MAVLGKINGPMLKSNLERNGEDLSFETNLLYLDVNNNRIGINQAVPTKSLQVDNVTVEGSQIRSTSGPLDLGSLTDFTISGGGSGYYLTSDGAGNLFWGNSSIPGSGRDLVLSYPDDSSLYPSGAINSWESTTNVTTAIDDLNELAQNIINNTAVANTDFTADQTVGGAGLVVTLTITADGNPNRYDIDWGDGNVTSNTSDSTPTHTYSSNVGSPFTVTVTAKNSSGVGTGSSNSKTRDDYINIFTGDPVVSFAAYAASSGGSPITYWDDGATVYFENTTTNIGSATIQFTWDWGDSSSDDVITNDSSAGGTAGARIAHTFTASTEQEVSRTVTLTLDSHSTAQSSVIPADDTASYKIYDTHTPEVTLSGTSGINEEASSGYVVTFTNGTENTIGNYTTYGIQYRYVWGDGNTTTVNAGSGSGGDIGYAINHTYALTSGQQAAGTAVDYTGNLEVISNHTSSPFLTTDFTVHVEPDVRANIAATAVTTSNGSADNQYTIYNFTDLAGNNRALVRATNTSQNADDYEYDWDDGSTNNTPTEDGVSSGSIGATLDHDYTGQSTGSYGLTFTANGTPDITAQTDTDTSITFTMKSVPSAPANLSTKSITLSTSYAGTSPRLAVGFTDNSSSNPLSASADLTTTTARRYTTGTIATSSVSNVYNGASGVLTAGINGSGDGDVTFSTSNNAGTYTSLVVSSNPDYHTVVSTVPSNFYQVFTAYVSKAITNYSVGVNDVRLEHSTTGNTNYVTVVRDNLTSSPTISSAGSLEEVTGGTKRYISGIPYYNTGSPTIQLTGATISNLVGQCYTNQTNIVEIDSGTNAEGTSSAAFTGQDYTYANIDGASSMLTGGIPNVNIGTSSPYAIGNLTVPITSSSVRTVDTAQVRAKNVNGTSSYSSIAEKIQVHTAAQSGISEIAIAVSDSLGNGTYLDDGVRIFDFNAATTDTPSFSGATNFYTNNPYTESSDPGVEGTKEATIRLGVLKYDVTDYSTGYLPVGPDRSADTGTQYFTFAFRRQVVANFDINITSSSGISGLWIAAPGTAIDSSSGLNGWLDCTIQYAGSGVPGSDTGNGGNGSNGCAFTGADVVSTGSSLSGGYTMTLGSENMSNATGNVVLVRIALASGESVSALSIGVAS